ncbi:hypothetical protein BGZ54_002176, partial [Gamsiella multidivaricata]
SRASPGQVSKLKLKNMTSAPVGYKFKTNAPMKYSVKPVLGWKTLDAKRFLESYIPCSSTSTLSSGDLEDDAGSISSSSATSSAASSPSFHAYDLSRASQQQQRPRQSQVFERWQYFEATRPTISIGGLGRRLSTSSSTCSSATSSPSTYPTLFTKPLESSSSSSPSTPPSPASTTPTTAYSSKRSSVSSNYHRQVITSTIKEEPANMGAGSGSGSGPSSEPTQHFLSELGFSKKQVLGTVSRLRIFQHYSMKQALLWSLVCLLLGMLMPFDRMTDIMGSGRSRESWMSPDTSDRYNMDTEDAREDAVQISIASSEREPSGIMDLKPSFESNGFYPASTTQQHEVVEGAV